MEKAAQPVGVRRARRCALPRPFQNSLLTKRFGRSESLHGLTRSCGPTRTTIRILQRRGASASESATPLSSARRIALAVIECVLRRIDTALVERLSRGGATQEPPEQEID